MMLYLPTPVNRTNCLLNIVDFPWMNKYYYDRLGTDFWRYLEQFTLEKQALFDLYFIAFNFAIRLDCRVVIRTKTDTICMNQIKKYAFESLKCAKKKIM